MSIDSLAFGNSLWSILLRFSVNLLVLFVLIRFIYYRFSGKDDYLFSFFLMGIVIFLICSILETNDIQMGMALGLFAIFAILRFRTVNYSVKEMTYTFTIIGISVINSQADVRPAVLGALLVNSIIVLTAYLLEIYLQKKSMTSLIVIYNKLKLLKPNLRKELLSELSDHTGQNIERIIIRKMDISKGNAEVEVYFKDRASS